MRRFRFIFGIVLALVVALPVFAASSSADAPHVHVQLVFPDENLYPGQQNDAGLYFKLEQGWHVYWQNAGDSGEPPHINWTLPAGMTAGPLLFPPPKRLPLGPLMDFGFENEVLFPLTIDVAKSAKPGSAVLHAKADWLVCREVCIPGKAELEKTLNVAASDTPSAESSDYNLWLRLANHLPAPFPKAGKAVFQSTTTGFRVAVDTGRRETHAAFFPEDQDTVDNPAPQTVTPTSTGLILDLKKDANLTVTPPQLKGVIELSGGRSYEIAAMPGTVAAVASVTGGNAAAGKLLRITGFAFLGGLLLNLMPCVFPVLFLKGLALVQSGAEERRRLRLHGLIYTTGILVSFWILVGALLGLRAAGATLGWGFQFQSPVFLFLLAGLFFFLGLALAGQFEIGLTLTSAGGSLAAKQGYAGSFFTGVLAVIVATPCTAPFMGAAIGYALAQSAAVTFAVFTALALGLAAPYLALTLQPAWTRWLPKPGAWMEVLKQAASLFMFGTVIWLTWVVTGAYGTGLLLAILAGFLLIAMAGWFLGRWPARPWATGVAAGLLVVFACLSVFAAKNMVTASETLSPPERQSAWQPWSAGAVQKSLAAGQPVFIDFTANWCLSCQVNERVALTKPEVMQAFQAHNVALFKADWTREDPAITEALTSLGRSGVPVYALYAPGQDAPQLLPQVLTPGIVTEALQRLPGETAGGEDAASTAGRETGATK